MQSATTTKSKLWEEMDGERGSDQSRTKCLVRADDGRRERLWVRIDVASGRSVRVMFEVGKEVASVMPTIPQPAPSSRMLRFSLDNTLARAGRCGRWLIFVVGREASAKVLR